MTELAPTLEKRFPEIAALYNKKLNDRPLSSLSPFSGYVAWWDCKEGHSWYGKVSSLTSKKQGCSVCAGFQIIAGFNDLESKFPEVANEWSYDKNGTVQPSEVGHGTHTKYWWKCKKNNHEWNISVFGRTNGGRNCPYCSGKKILQGFNDFPTLHPKVYKEWDHELNQIDPFTLGGGLTICLIGSVRQKGIITHVLSKVEL